MSDFFDENVQNDLLGLEGRGRGRGVPFKHRSRGSRAEMEKHFKSLPGRIKRELKMGKLRLGDQVIYSIASVGSSTTIKMFQTQDDKEVGLRNISNAKLPKNQAMLVSGIYLLAGQTTAAVPGSPTPDEIKSTHFQTIEQSNFAAIANGEFSLKANKVQIVPETSMRVFCTDQNAMWAQGFYKLHNPRLIHDDVLVECTLELGTVAGIPQDTQIYVGLYGTMTTP
ncbi:MAG: hypothetical protein AAF998_10585 [Bacteroidota bacterium]